MTEVRRAHVLSGLVAVGVAVVASQAAAQEPAAAARPAEPRREAPLSVHIESPHAGIVEGPEVELEARVSDPRVTSAVLEVNGQSYHVPVEQGRVTQNIVAIPGNNRVALVVARGGRVAHDSLTFRYEGEPIEMVVLLTWPTRGEIIDLWVREPGGETCKWDHRDTESGGRLLDFSADAIGFGSQAYVLREAVAGRFRIKVHYWGSAGDDDQRGIWTHQELIAELDQLDQRLATLAAGSSERATAERERQRVIERLDAWASPAATQTPVHGEVVAFPGTRHERRFRFDIVVHRTGDLTTLGEVEIDEALVAAARRDR